MRDKLVLRRVNSKNGSNPTRGDLSTVLWFIPISARGKAFYLFINFYKRVAGEFEEVAKEKINTVKHLDIPDRGGNLCLELLNITPNQSQDNQFRGRNVNTRNT